MDDQFAAVGHALYLAIENDQPETIMAILNKMPDKRKAYEALSTVFEMHFTGRPAQFLASLPSQQRVKMAAILLTKYYLDKNESIGDVFDIVLRDRFSVAERTEVIEKYLPPFSDQEFFSYLRFILLCKPLHLSLVFSLMAAIDQKLLENNLDDAEKIKETTKNLILHEIDSSIIVEILVRYLDTNQLRFKLLSLIPDSIFDRVLSLALFGAVKESAPKALSALLNLLPAKKRLHIVLEKDSFDKTLFHYAAKRRDARMIFESVIDTLPVHVDSLEFSAVGVDQLVVALTKASQPASRSESNELPKFGSFLNALGLSALTGVNEKEVKSPEDKKQMNQHSK